MATGGVRGGRVGLACMPWGVCVCVCAVHAHCNRHAEKATRQAFSPS